MSSIRLHPKHGANPTISQCFWCGGEKNELALLGAERDELAKKLDEATEHGWWVPQADYDALAADLAAANERIAREGRHANRVRILQLEADLAEARANNERLETFIRESALNKGVPASVVDAALAQAKCHWNECPHGPDCVHAAQEGK